MMPTPGALVLPARSVAGTLAENVFTPGMNDQACLQYVGVRPSGGKTRRASDATHWTDTN